MDFDTFAARVDAPKDLLARVRPSLERFVALAGLSDTGIRGVFERMPLDNVPPAAFFALRRANGATSG